MKNKLLLPIVLILLGFLTLAFFISIPKSPSTKQVEKTQNQDTVQGISTTVQSPSIATKQNEALVIRVIDGDTIEIGGGQKVRYIGIDTPETVDPRKPVQCFGKEASDQNKLLVEGKSIRLEKDVSEADKYGRLLRYVYVGDTMVNDLMLRQGFAHASTYPPDVKYQNEFLKAQAEAQQNGRGLWSTCSQSPGTNQSSAKSSDTGCVIKGNISSSGEKIYHMPGQKYYDQTVIDNSKGERYFCTEDEAQSSGWRKSKL